MSLSSRVAQSSKNSLQSDSSESDLAELADTDDSTALQRLNDLKNGRRGSASSNEVGIARIVLTEIASSLISDLPDAGTKRLASARKASIELVSCSFAGPEVVCTTSSREGRDSSSGEEREMRRTISRPARGEGQLRFGRALDPYQFTWEALSRGPLQQLEHDGAFCFVEGAGGFFGSSGGDEEVGDEAVERGDFGSREGEGGRRLVGGELVVELTELAPQSGEVGGSKGKEGFLSREKVG